MRALAEDINRIADKCTNYSGSIAPGAMVEFDDFDSIINEVDRTLWAIRTLDHEVFHKSDNSAYGNLRDAVPQGRVVWAFASLRDVATHRADVVGPDIGRAVGPTPEGKFLISPRWKKRADLPSEIFRKQDGGVYHTRTAAYDNHVAGRYLLDTLLDAFAFFDQCDKRLARRDADGQVEGFPLPSLAAAGIGYYRLGPDWPTHEQAAHHLFRVAADVIPAGTARSIVGTIQGGTAVCGWTEMGRCGRVSFTEPVRQIVADIGRGYPYVLDADGSLITVDQDQLATADGRALVDAVPDVEAATDAAWMTWWVGIAAHADLYMRQRKGI